MIDFWEALGRMAAKPTFLQEILTAIGPNPNIEVITGYWQNPNSNYFSLVKDPTNTNNVRQLMSTECEGRPISLMGVGEMILAVYTPAQQDRITTVAKAIAASNAAFQLTQWGYVALGAMIIDAPLLAALIGVEPHSEFDTNGLGAVLPVDRTALDPVMRLIGPAGLVQEAQQFSATWGTVCLAKFAFFNTYQHPVVRPTGLLNQ
jgi:hypothetical protein